MIFDGHVYDEIRRAWIADQNHPHRNRRDIPTPTLAELRGIIDVSFKSSLRTEEGQSSRFAVSVIPKETDQREALLEGTHQIIFTLAEDVPLCEDSLTKLSVVCDPRIGCLLADWEGSSTKSGRIWGLAYFGETDSLWDEVPVGIEGFITQRPDVLTVTSVSPGSLVLSRGEARIGRFILGEFIPATPSPLTSNAMGSHIRKRLSKSELFHQHGNKFWLFFRDALDYLLSETSSMGHGATVIICPSASMEDVTNDYKAKFGLDGDLQVRKLFERSIEALSNKPTGIGGLSSKLLDDTKVRKLTKTRLDFIAQLAAADGALILTEEFQPIAFGAKLDAPDLNGWTIVVGPDGFGGGGGEPFDLSELGMRHNSAARFLAAHPITFGFVVSQDGPIRGMAVQDEHTLLVWKDCRVSMFTTD